jgi:hypothetical protein
MIKKIKKCTGHPMVKPCSGNKEQGFCSLPLFVFDFQQSGAKWIINQPNAAVPENVMICSKIVYPAASMNQWVA